MNRHVMPEPGLLEALADIPDNEPVVMLNLLRFRGQAEYDAASPHAGCNGREAYSRYGAVASKQVAAVGGKPIWMGLAQLTLIGPSDEKWDEVLLIEYPSRQAFLKMVAEPEYLAAVEHRDAALEDSRLVAMRAIARRG